MIAKMTRYDFILLSRDTDAFISGLQDYGIIDVTRSVKAIDSASSEMIAEAEALKKRMGWLKAGQFEMDSEYSLIKARIAALEKEKLELSHWGEFTPERLSELAEAGMELKFYKISRKNFDSSWTEKYPLEIIDDNGRTIWMVTAGGTDIPATPAATPSRSASQVELELANLRGQLSGRAAELKAEDTDSLQKQYETLLSELDFHFAKVASSSAVEDTVTVITGFAPSEYDDKLKAAFDSEEIFYTSSGACVEDNPPIKLKNNKFVSMFEVLTDMYGRPSYDGFDPTPFISVFFLLFFAMCMGDAGYGIVLIILGLLLGKNKSFAKLAPLVITLGAGTFVVGFLFHTFFSMDISQWSWIPEWLKSIMVPAKIATYDGTMVLAIVIGIIHLCLAMIVRTVQSTRTKGFAQSLGTWGWTIFIVGSVAVGAAALAGVIDSKVTKAIIIGLGCISANGIFLLNDIHRNPVKNIGAGLWETYNTVTGLLGDVLSYLRLYALGLAGGMLGFAFNDLGNMVLSSGGVAGWTGFILIVLVGHTLNVAMAVLGAFVHPLRLNFLEFFKNSGYEGTGRNYNPLKK